MGQKFTGYHHVIQEYVRSPGRGILNYHAYLSSIITSSLPPNAPESIQIKEKLSKYTKKDCYCLKKSTPQSEKKNVNELTQKKLDFPPNSPIFNKIEAERLQTWHIDMSALRVHKDWLISLIAQSNLVVLVGKSRAERIWVLRTGATILGFLPSTTDHILLVNDYIPN